jgi:hypothetical protein
MVLKQSLLVIQTQKTHWLFLIFFKEITQERGQSIIAVTPQ